MENKRIPVNITPAQFAAIGTAFELRSRRSDSHFRYFLFEWEEEVKRKAEYYDSIPIEQFLEFAGFYLQ